MFAQTVFAQKEQQRAALSNLKPHLDDLAAMDEVMLSQVISTVDEY